MLKTQMTVLELVVLSQILRRTFCEEQLVEAICDWAVSSQISFSERITRITTNYVVFLGKMTYYHNNYHPPRGGVILGSAKNNKTPNTTTTNNYNNHQLPQNAQQPQQTVNNPNNHSTTSTNTQLPSTNSTTIN